MTDEGAQHNGPEQVCVVCHGNEHELQGSATVWRVAGYRGYTRTQKENATVKAYIPALGNLYRKGTRVLLLSQ